MQLAWEAEEAEGFVGAAAGAAASAGAGAAEEKKAAADSKLQVKKTEESALEKQAKLQKELDEANAARDLLFAQNKTHISDLAKEKEE